MPAQGRAEGVVGRSVQHFIARADFRAGADDAAGEGHDRAFDLIHCLLRRLGGTECRFIIGAADEQIAAADRALVKLVVASQRNSPSMTGMRQKWRSPNFFEICQPSPKYRKRSPTFNSSGAFKSAKQAEPGEVSTHWPTRFVT